jgi:hypothetical protein
MFSLLFPLHKISVSNLYHFPLISLCAHATNNISLHRLKLTRAVHSTTTTIPPGVYTSERVSSSAAGYYRLGS